MFKVKLQGFKIKRIRPYHGCGVSNIRNLACVSSPCLWLSMVGSNIGIRIVSNVEIRTGWRLELGLGVKTISRLTMGNIKHDRQQDLDKCWKWEWPWSDNSWLRCDRKIPHDSWHVMMVTVQWITRSHYLFFRSTLPRSRMPTLTRESHHRWWTETSLSNERFWNRSWLCRTLALVRHHRHSKICAEYWNENTGH